MRLGFLGLPIGRSRGPRKEISWKVTKDMMQLAIELGHPGSKEFPGSCLMLLNVINPWDVRASLLKETGRATGEVALSTHTYVHKCKDQSAYFTGVNNPMTYPADVVIAN